MMVPETMRFDFNLEKTSKMTQTVDVNRGKKR